MPPQWRNNPKYEEDFLFLDDFPILIFTNITWHLNFRSREFCHPGLILLPLGTQAPISASTRADLVCVADQFLPQPCNVFHIKDGRLLEHRKNCECCPVDLFSRATIETFLPPSNANAHQSNVWACTLDFRGETTTTTTTTTTTRRMTRTPRTRRSSRRTTTTTLTTRKTKN